MKNLENLFKRKKSESSGPLFGFGTNPQSDWKVIFFSALALLLIVSAANALIFIKIKNGEIFSASYSSSVETPTLDINKLKATTAYYQNKAEQFANIRSASSTAITDPSI